MTSMPLWYVLVPFAALVLAAALFFFFNIFHISRYGVRSPGTVMLMGAYVVTFFGLLGAIALTLSTVDWQARITPEDIMPNFGSTTNFGL